MGLMNLGMYSQITHTHTHTHTHIHTHTHTHTNTNTHMHIDLCHHGQSNKVIAIF